MANLTRDSLLHFVHFLMIFSLASLLACELALFAKSLPRATFDRLVVVDRWYGISAGLVIITGLSLLFFGLKPPTFYTHNPVFWTKMVLFVCVALLSIPMTVRLIRTPDAVGTNDIVTFDDAEFRRLRRFLWAEVAVFVFIPLCATLMANGI